MVRKIPAIEHGRLQVRVAPRRLNENCLKISIRGSERRDGTHLLIEEEISFEELPRLLHAIVDMAGEAVAEEIKKIEETNEHVYRLKDLRQALNCLERLMEVLEEEVEQAA